MPHANTVIDPNAVARAVGIGTEFSNLGASNIRNLPQRIAVFGQGSVGTTFSLDPRQVLSELEAGQAYGFGSPIHLAVRRLLPSNGVGSVGTIPVTVYPVPDEDDGNTQATATMIFAGAQVGAGVYTLVIGGVSTAPFTIPDGANTSVAVFNTAQAINAVPHMPVTAVQTDGTTITLTCKWMGTSGNEVDVDLIYSGAPGLSVATNNLSGGTDNPTAGGVQMQLDNIAERWETIIVSCFEMEDTVILDTFSAWGESRWLPLVRKPAVVIMGGRSDRESDYTDITSARRTDRTSVIVPVPGSSDMPLSIAAEAVARIAVLANNNPPHDYGSQVLNSIDRGRVIDAFDYAARNLLVTSGTSTTVVKDNVVNLSDTVTFYHPAGDTNPGYRYVVDVIKLQNVIHRLDSIFNTPEWDGAPLIPNGQPTTNRAAKRPKTAVAAIAAELDQLGLEAIISDPKGAKAAITAEIDSGNPKRLNVNVSVRLSGNTNIVAVGLHFGFLFGTQAVL